MHINVDMNMHRDVDMNMHRDVDMNMHRDVPMNMHRGRANVLVFECQSVPSRRGVQLL